MRFQLVTSKRLLKLHGIVNGMVFLSKSNLLT